MERPDVAHLRTTRQALQTGRGRIYRCNRCDEQVVIPFSPTLSLLLGSEDLLDVHRLVQDGLKWLDEPGSVPADDVVN